MGTEVLLVKLETIHFECFLSAYALRPLTCLPSKNVTDSDSANGKTTVL
jgi:hypothetical protein